MLALETCASCWLCLHAYLLGVLQYIREQNEKAQQQQQQQRGSSSGSGVCGIVYCFTKKVRYSDNVLLACYAFVYFMYFSTVSVPVMLCKCRLCHLHYTAHMIYCA
jgi:hypothetical protein